MVHKSRPHGSQKRFTNGSKKGGVVRDLTPAEAEILDLFHHQFMTVAEIAHRRKCSMTIVYRHLKRIHQKGRGPMVHKHSSKSEPYYGGPSGSKSELGRIRRHGDHFQIRIHWAPDSYLKHYVGLSSRRNGCLVKYHENSIEVHNQDLSFWGDDVAEADRAAVRHWSAFWVDLEHEVGVKIWVEGSRNIEEKVAHYAKVGNETTREILKAENRVMVRGPRGKIWLIFDKSHGLQEAETIEKGRAARHMEEIVSPFFNSLENGKFDRYMENQRQQAEILVKTMTLLLEDMKTRIQAVPDPGPPVERDLRRDYIQ